MNGLLSTPVIPTLPDYFAPGTGGEFPEDIVGSKISGIGTIDSSFRIEGGGLVVDYIPKGSEASKRVVLGFNELGMWIVDTD